ncbi:DUF221-domain-containing protein [Cutaneotrichosporon oleaginosum]|uniref:DUF221-domain-containing protein n=1 Tax=Cutaneotrichosporon oleaginosum TaxID=879819 RepID=A0A0J0XMK2_9TREE|nr:DUF221-domain-containing protein [Cutaneotrichosporon oleaginosum]KLT42385.1 DUF221-domain-containing protein [Cutaneotrichosporon oleaginosum]TXT04204.1 hypothetical protein COLE_07901 [Cutaneotrichosporon oleaginosum]
MLTLASTDYSQNTLNAAATASTATFVTAFATNAAVAGAQLLAWIIIRGWVKAVYEPRTYIPAREKQAEPLGRNLILPIWKIIKADPKDILRKNGVDPYLFLRFVAMLAKALIPIWFVSWIVLMPVNSARMSGKDGLDQFTFGNVARNQQDRYWAHLVLIYVFNAWWFYLIWKEMAHWLEIRQQYLVSPSHSKLAQASTILVTGIPEHLMEERALAKLFSHLPGGVRRIWLVRNLKDMPDVYDRREKACKILESAQVELMKKACMRKRKLAREIKKATRKGRPIPEHCTAPANPPNEDGTPLSLADELVPRKDRPLHRLKPHWAPFRLGFFGIGEKVDAIEWAQKEIVECTALLTEERQKLAKDIDTPGFSNENYPARSSAFVHFNQQIAAHMAQQCLTYQQPFRMNYRYIEQSPENVIWGNMRLNAYEINVRRAISYAITGGLIFAWAPLTALVGGLANVVTLVEKWKWLSWLIGDSFGKQLLQGIFTGIIPPVLLALLTMIFPIVLRLLSTFQGTVSKTEVELDVMNRYFVFLVIHAFLITTLASGLVAAIKPLMDNPASIASILATNLPTASTFFITRILLQFTGLIGNLLQPVTVVLYYVRVILGGGTPRRIFNSRYQLEEPEFGTEYPNVTVYANIMITYMIISPVINGFGACFCMLAYFVYKYLYMWVMDLPPSADTGGLFFPKAITQIFIGFYIQEVCLCALFFLARNEQNKVSALPQAILMIILIVLTAAFNWLIKTMYNPLKVSLPLSMADLSYGMPDAGEELKRAESRGEIVPKPPVEEKHPEIEDVHWDNTALKWNEGASSGDEVERTTSATSAGDSTSPCNPTPEKKMSYSDPTPEKKPSYSEEDPHPHPQPFPQQHPESFELAEIGDSKRRLSRTRRNSRISLRRRSRVDEDEEPEEDPETQYFALPGGPGVIIHSAEEADDPGAFFHPATKDPQPPIWLPVDELGLGAEQNAANLALGVRSSTKNATMGSKGQVKIMGVPPE